MWYLYLRDKGMTRRVLRAHSKAKKNKHYCTWENKNSAACEYIVGICCISTTISVRSQGTIYKAQERKQIVVKDYNTNGIF